MKFRGITTSELEDEIRRRRDNPTKEEADAQKKAEKERQTKMTLDRLHKQEPREAYSMWEIKAEAGNPDMGGSHHQERLAVVRGSYRKACDYAIKLKGFYTWGYGGDVVPIKQEDFIDLEE